ncbi:hypothetical protein D6D15_07200 [Aureobasidium pullulans]|uniref:Uncharacterized protein n=1 Tax=Aureobasidium pullulans TaxID=5580 RepID=A0A4V4IUS7_AURPU|nr:hypothetical protein D6D15_07200 [Aureobasidium pullulans]
MPPRLFERLSAAFWGYVSPQQAAAHKRSTVTRTAQPSTASPYKFITPERHVGGYEPLTPEDTQPGSKRKRLTEIEDQRKRRREEREAELEAICLEDLELEYLAKPVDQYESDGIFSEDDEYDSGDEDEEGGAYYNHDVHNPTFDTLETMGQVFEGEGDYDDGIEYDYSIYNPTIRSDRPLSGKETLLPSTIIRQTPKKVPQIVIDSVEEEEEEDEQDDVINVLPRHDTPVYGNGDEDLIVFADTDASDNDALDVDHNKDDSSIIASNNNASIFESFFEEAIDGDTILVDSRARVGSLEDERVTKQQLLDRNWPENNVWLVQRIHNRGREPLFANHWRLDFPMMPEGMFLPPHHIHPGYINTLRSADFRAKHAFNRLMQLGPKVRDKLLVNKNPENLIVAEIRRYMDWGEWDSNNQFPNHPFIKIHAGGRDEDVEAMQDELLSRLHTLHQHWAIQTSTTPFPSVPNRPDINTPPPLYGILVSHTLVGIVAFVPGGDSSDSVGYLRTVGVFDFSISGYDVWTSLALALLVIHVRDVGVKRGCARRPSGYRDRWAQRLSQDRDA